MPASILGFLSLEKPWRYIKLRIFKPHRLNQLWYLRSKFGLPCHELLRSYLLFGRKRTKSTDTFITSTRHSVNEMQDKLHTLPAVSGESSRDNCRIARPDPKALLYQMSNRDQGGQYHPCLEYRASQDLLTNRVVIKPLPVLGIHRHVFFSTPRQKLGKCVAGLYLWLDD